MLWPFIVSKKINGFKATSILLIPTSRGKRTYVIHQKQHGVHTEQLVHCELLVSDSFLAMVTRCWFKNLTKWNLFWKRCSSKMVKATTKTLESNNIHTSTYNTLHSFHSTFILLKAQYSPHYTGSANEVATFF